MNAALPRKELLCLWLAALVLGLPTSNPAQSPSATPTPPDPLAGVPVQVLDRQQITCGTHTVTLNRIAPPVFPSPAPTTKSPSGTNTATGNRRTQIRGTRQPVARTSDAADGGNQASRMVFLSATVYDHQFTLLRWFDGNRPGFSVYVNLDFNYFAGVGQIETADTVYALFFGLGDDTAASLTAVGQPLPDLAAFPTGYSAYQLVTGDPAAHSDAIAALEALCAYYDANQGQMIAAHNQQQAAYALYQQWLLANPPTQPNTVVNYWPVRSQSYLPRGH